MEAAEETLTYRDDTGLHRKLLQADNKDKHWKKKKIHAAETEHRAESNYVDLDMKPDGAKTVKVTFTGEGNQLSIMKCDGPKQGESDPERESLSEEPLLEDERTAVLVPVSAVETPRELTELTELTELHDIEQVCEKEPEPVHSDGSEHVRSESDELQYTDMYLNSKTESDDGMLSDRCGSETPEDESHYITTHEIQLTELDHDVDYDLGRGTCWDFEDNNLVYSFVDYASFESDDTQEGTLIVEGGKSQAKVQSHLVSTEQEDSDICDSEKGASSDESVCKDQSGDVNAGKIRFSIKTSSMALNEPVNIFDNSTCGYTRHFGDRSHFSYVSSGARTGPLCDRAQYFIPAPGRQHLASKLRRKDINEYSSGASSSISELDDADKEVRNLTAKSFRSLACPYFDAINLSASSESSVSEYGLNNWSAYYLGGERGVLTHTTSSATLEMSKTVDSKSHGKSSTGSKSPQTKMYTLNKKTFPRKASSSSNDFEIQDLCQSKQRGVTLNFRCNVDAPKGARRTKSSKTSRANDITAVAPEHKEDTHKRSVFASSLLQNVISKKMQFEQECKMERHETHGTHPDMSKGRSLQRQTSETSSGFNSPDERLKDSRPNSCEHVEEQITDKTLHDSEKAQQKPPNAMLNHSQSSAFNSLKQDEPKSVQFAEPTSVSDTQSSAKEAIDTSSMLTKLLFVPSYQLVPKEKDFTRDLPSRELVTHPPVGPEQCEKELKTSSNVNTVTKEGSEKVGKPPEIKICLRSVKETKGCTLNIANLLTPKITFNAVNTFRAAGDAKCQVLSASHKIPNFTVRDIRDTKCKFQTPIYHVRDVRKLVKSSYRFVSLDKTDSKCSAVADRAEEKASKVPVRNLLPSPIVIKCQSVKTNVKQQAAEGLPRHTEAGIPCETSQSESTPSHCPTSKVPFVVSKQPQPELSETQPHVESKLTKQRQEKMVGETAERKNEPAVPKQAALEKLKAAVKTMEQLYVFDRNEWKRKIRAPQPITGSHVLSLIAREEQGAEELETAKTDGIPQSSINPTAETGKPQDNKGAPNIIHVPFNDATFKTQSQQSKTFCNKSVLHFGNKARVSISSVSNPIPQSSALQTSATMKSFNTAVAPLSVKIEPPKHSQVEQGKVKTIPTNSTVTQACPDSENYLTIPGLGYMNEIKLPNREPASSEVSSNVCQINTGDINAPEQKRSPQIMEYPAASSIYHPGVTTTGPPAQPQVLCFRPIPTVSPTPPAGEAVPQTQRKMLLDPTTGHYYLVDTPIQPATKRLFDPETGQYVDVPMPHSPASPVTPVPLSLSPMAMTPGAYAPTYMIYPGFIPSPTLPAQAQVMPQRQSEDFGGEKVKSVRIGSGLESNATGAESVYYSATGEATPQAASDPLKLPVSLGHVTARGDVVAGSSDRKPVISITTQQGPRIIAPPSFDGTTMSFVVEHR